MTTSPSQPALDDSTIFEPDPGIETAHHVDGMTVRLKKTGAYFSLNDTGGFVWTLLGQANSLSAVKEAAAERYGAPREATDPTIERFVGALVSEGLLIPKPSLGGTQR